jgi:sorbitol-specific phosphotransferase system component IIBC
LLEDKDFLADLEKNCATKSAEWSKIVSMRNEELLALADTIKVLNDDDALELFKKTLPGSSASFVQMQTSTNRASTRARVLAAIQQAQQSSKVARPLYDFIAMAIKGKQIGLKHKFEMIDGMVATLKKEQTDDDNKKEYCAKQFDVSEEKKKEIEHALADVESVIAEAKEGIATTKSEIEALEDGIKALDKSVAEATEQRKEENEDFTELMASDTAAKELLGFAKNRTQTPRGTFSTFGWPRIGKKPQY